MIGVGVKVRVGVIDGVEVELGVGEAVGGIGVGEADGGIGLAVHVGAACI